MLNKIILLILLLIPACGEDGKMGVPGQDGAVGKAGADGRDGADVEVGELSIFVDRTATPWDENNFTFLHIDAVILLPNSFEVSSLGRKENGGWLDFRLGSQVFCYQGRVNSRRYEFKYKKADGAVTGCDQNNDKSENPVNLNVKLVSASQIQIIPRAPRFDVMVEFKFPYIGVEDVR